MGVFRTLSAAASQPAAAELEAQSSSSGTIIKSAKRNISQSPWKLRFLVTLAHQKWYPEAMAQMKFSPKLYSKEIGDILKRGADSANMYHSAIPEELFVKEIYVNKGASRRKMRIMGRGRTGIGYVVYTYTCTYTCCCAVHNASICLAVRVLGALLPLSLSTLRNSN